MPASEHAAEPSAEREARSGRTRPVPVAPAVSMRDLLASCAAATAVSTPPRTSTAAGDAHRDAA
ncbi:hypothetical protein [Streptomyces sp. NPDC006274]|uniref:hypothetical protein n=1 Tax=unclassified Streptomyces TaxID=2593676 RepID=UPI0033B1825B